MGPNSSLITYHESRLILPSSLLQHASVVARPGRELGLQSRGPFDFSDSGKSGLLGQGTEAFSSDLLYSMAKY